MDAKQFKGSSAGRVVPVGHGVVAFVPDPLPPKLNLEPLIPLLQEAAMSLGELNGIGRTMANPYLLISPIQKREAIASSSIEGTVTSLPDLFLFEEGADETKRPPDTREVHNYVRALEHGIRRLEELPLCLRLIREVHGILLEGVQKHRGANIVPGEFRGDQNWIGGRTVSVARFVPPPRSELMGCLDSFEKFLQSDEHNNLPPLVRMALVHYQFETIHPFPDGNGRVGRLLVPLYLCEKGILPQPLLYMSTYFEQYKDEYIDLLYNVSVSGGWHDWLEFFLVGVRAQCQDTILRVGKLLELQATYRAALAEVRSTALATRLVDIIFERPFLTIPRVASALEVTYRSARKTVEKLVDLGMVQELEGGTRPRFFVAQDVFEIIHTDIID